MLNYVVLAVLSALGAASAHWIWSVFFYYRRLIKCMNQLPGEEGYPFPIGNLFLCRRKHDEYFRDTYALAHRMTSVSPTGIYRFWMGPIPYVILSKGVSVEMVLSSMRHIEKGFEYGYLHPWLGTGLLTSKGEKWRMRRKLLTPAFHFQILADFVEVFYEQSLVLVQQLETRANGEIVNIYPFITKCALDIICETAMGKKVNAQTRDESDVDYVQAVYSVANVTFDRMIKPAWMFDILFYTFGRGRQFNKDLKRLHDFTDQVIMEKKAGINEVRRNSVSASSKRSRMAFLDSLLQARTEDGHELDNASIREEVDTFMFEGHDTTAAAANFAVYCLGAHPEVQAKAHEEVDAVFGRSQRCPTVDDLKNLTYLEMVIKETLRLFPSVPFISRRCNEDFHIGQYLVPKGSTIGINIYAMHRDDDLFPDAEKFDPERFEGRGHADVGSAGNDTSNAAFDYIPFSAGPRNCIGQRFALMEEKTILSTLLRNFVIESIVPMKDFVVQGQLILRPINGVPVKLISRK